ncbi:MAG: deoxyribose-phosphate aldolase [Candidatus Calescibacterium sp.]|nr:deoxyribose-phosphate aldolase [Candidatus Calescibacterium sp.]MDW8132686.1 deoxyribose-phosphate aldolase [Candidatus Calescibacterium sp.]
MKILKEFYLPIDTKMLNERVESLSRRSIKKESKLWVLRFIISCMDLTTLEGKDTFGKVEHLVYKAVKPFEGVPSVAAVCLYPSLVREAKSLLMRIGENNVKVATVATYFPSGQVDWSIKQREIIYALEEGADEVDMVINRRDFLEGRYWAVYDEINKAKEICHKFGAHLKVILETGELPTYEHIRLASLLAMFAGADFIKTSTGKVNPAATLQSFLVMLYAIKDFYYYTGKKIGIKPAGGIKTSKDAIRYTVVLNETLGDYFMTPEYYRIGASSLINDVLMQYKKELTGAYQAEEYFSLG